MGQASACPAASPPIRSSRRPARTFPSRTKGICVHLMTTEDVRTFGDHCAGRLSRYRRKSLLSLNLDMVLAMTRALLDWRSDPDVRIVLIDHAEGRGFCAGGDVVTIAKDVPQGAQVGRDFFFHEYRLNHLMYTYPKPGVAFMDGVTMGGGVGISCPCRYRVATERTLFAMPETTIGRFPDVGGGRYLSRRRGRSAQYLALTGARLNGADCVALGLASHYIPSERLEDVQAQICANPEKTESILAGAVAAPPLAPLVEQREGGVTLITRNRPQALIALINLVLGELNAAMAAFDAGAGQGCAVLT